MKQPANQRKSIKQFEQLDKALVAALDEYFRLLKDGKAKRLHKVVFTRVEKVLFEYLLQREEYHQSKVCDILGISRSTLRSRLRAYKIQLPKRKQP